jgi:predicted nuclease with TOPRIM domain
MEDTKDQLQRHAPSPAPSDEHKELSAHEIRRRAQNRASQRAFRERKRNHAESLQQQVREMQKTHDELLRAFKHKEDEVSELQDKIDDLENKIRLLDTPSLSSQSLQTPASFQFEPVDFDDPYNRWSAAQYQIPVGWDGRLQGPDGGFDVQSLSGGF